MAQPGGWAQGCPAMQATASQWAHAPLATATVGAPAGFRDGAPALRRAAASVRQPGPMHDAARKWPLARL
eukprot:8319175-Lingulodinium_polyedra.AAC.1